ncbi:hypothetical protein LINPERPRIM_LOCUS34734 [Linum perenne]
MAVMARNKSRRRDKRPISSLYQLDPSFYNKIISRKSSVGNPDPNPNPANVPFLWEVHPGTPKRIGDSWPPPVAKSPPPSFRVPKLTGFQQLRGRKRGIPVKKFGSEIGGKAKEVFWKGVDGAQRKMKSVSGRKIVRQLKARVSPVMDRRGEGGSGSSSSSSSGIRFRDVFSSGELKFHSGGKFPPFLSVFRRGSSPAIDAPASSRFGWRTVLGKKLMTKWKLLKAKTT